MLQQNKVYGIYNRVYVTVNRHLSLKGRCLFYVRTK
nr:MAG TPA: hypothetical protein [Caudoviricetes sp.]